MNKKSFTLIELIVVIAIIAVLAAIVAPNAFKAIEKSKVSNYLATYKTIKKTSLALYSDTGNWPAACLFGGCDATALFVDDGSIGWDGPYLSKWPKAQWGDNLALWNVQPAARLRSTSTRELALLHWGTPKQEILNLIDEKVDGGDGFNIDQGDIQIRNIWINNLIALISYDE